MNTTSPARRLMIGWLNDAHAMEVGLVPILENHARDAEHLPELRARIERHAEETRRHAELVRGCLERLGEQPSLVKSTASRLMGGIEQFATAPFRDEEVKNGLLDYTTEHFEIAAYKALIAAANEMAHPEVAAVCEGILREEEDMARFLEGQLPATVRIALRQAE